MKNDQQHEEHFQSAIFHNDIGTVKECIAQGLIMYPRVYIRCTMETHRSDGIASPP